MAILTVAESGADYTTLALALAAAVDGDSVEISGTWSSAETASLPSKHVHIYAVGASKHPGRVWRTGDTHFRIRTASGHMFTITGTGSFTIEDIDAQNESTGVSDELFRNNVANTFLAKNCLLGFKARIDQQDILYTEAAADITFTNCHFYNVYRAVVDGYTHAAGLVVSINSCTGWDIGYSTDSTLRSGVVGTTGNNTATVRVFNSLFHINTGYTFSAALANSVTAHCHSVISSSAEQQIYGNVNLITDTDNLRNRTITTSTATAAYIVSDTTTATLDLRLTDHANNTAQDNHANGTGAGLTMPTTDIMGTARPQNTNYDIGAFEIIAGGATTTTQNSSLDMEFTPRANFQ